MDEALFGRDRELEAGSRFLESKQPRGLIVEGVAGIGKTAVWRALLETARAGGYRVLECIGDSAEARLTFVGLADLLGEAADEVLPQLSPPQAHALEVAPLRTEAVAAPGDPRAVVAAVLGAFRALATRQPVVVAIDDIPWLDRASADAVTFAARRLRDEPVRFLLTRRPRAASLMERALAPQLQRMEVGPLSLGAIRRMLAERLDLTLSRQLLRRIFDSTLGNPLFALELGRMLVEQGLPAPGADLPVPDTVEELLGTRVTRLPRSVRTLLLAVALNGDLELAQLAAIAAPVTLDNAIERGLLLVAGGRIRSAHPLLAAAAKKRSGVRERRELHLTLAETVSDETLRAHHLALANWSPDPELAATVAAAAANAFARGARGEAVELGEHALRLTPTESAQRPERLLALASYLETAGESERIRELLTANLEAIPSGPLRARAWLLLSEAVYVHLDDYRWQLEQALVEARADPGLHALVVAKMSSAVISVERIADAEARTLEVLPAAERAGPEVERAVLFALAWARGLRGLALDDLCERWGAPHPPLLGILPSHPNGWQASGASGAARSSRHRRRSSGFSQSAMTVASSSPTPGRDCIFVSSRSESAIGRRLTGCSTSGPRQPNASSLSNRMTGVAALCWRQAAVFPRRRCSGQSRRSPGRRQSASSGIGSGACERAGSPRCLHTSLRVPPRVSPKSGSTPPGRGLMSPAYSQ